MSEQRPFDVVVVGAGMVGSLFTLLLLQDPQLAGLRVAVVEAEPLRDWSNTGEFDPRVSALTPASLALIAAAGCGQAFAELRQCAYTDMRVWDADGTGSVHFQARDAGLPHLGVLVENAALQSLLTRALVQRPQVSWLGPQRWQSLERLAGGRWRLVLADGAVLETGCLVAADGPLSPIREAAGIAVDSHDYHQRALVCIARTEQAHQMTAWQRFLPGGPLAFLPLSDAHHCAVVWSLPEAEAGALGELDDANFRQRLEQALESRLGTVAAVGARYAFPLRARHARDYCLPGLALIGDAAHSIHPLAGQGVNIGLQDAAVLAREMQAAAGSRLPLAHARVLSRYQRQRRGDNALTLHAMTGFQRLFGASDAMLRVLRNQGMRWFDRSGPLKRQVVRLATGR